MNADEPVVITEEGVADKVTVHVGNLEINLNERGFGSVTVDGLEQYCTELTLRIKVGEIPQFTLTRYCQ